MRTVRPASRADAAASPSRHVARGSACRPGRCARRVTTSLAGLALGLAGLAAVAAVGGAMGLERAGFAPIGAAMAAQAADPSAFGRDLASGCAGCHNTGGRAIGSGVPIAGMPADRMIQAMTDFRDGRRAASVMHQIAKGYTPEQIRLMAAYFAAQPTTK